MLIPYSFTVCSGEVCTMNCPRCSGQDYIRIYAKYEDMKPDRYECLDCGLITEIKLGGSN